MSPMPALARRTTLALLAALLSCSAVRAQAPPAESYAVMSLVGDKLVLVRPRETVGSHVDRNLRQEIVSQDDALDEIVVRAAAAAIRRLRPDATTILFTTRDKKLFALQDRLIEADTISPDLAQSLKALLGGSQATHLLLITKHRADASMQLYDTKVGIGTLAGLGFYVDRLHELRDVDSGQQRIGFYAPYAYLRYTLLNAADLKPQQQVVAHDATVVASEPTSTVDAWQVATTRQRAEALDTLLRRAVDGATARLLTGN